MFKKALNFTVLLKDNFSFSVKKNILNILRSHNSRISFATAVQQIHGYSSIYLYE